MTEHVILVDEKDIEIGTMPKMEAHEKGLLHRAFSVFIFNKKGELLLQQRALDKYHSAGLWTNTCCSHPRSNESTINAAQRRLKEEMGIECELEKKFDFIYKTEFDNGLTEHEYDHVFFGETDVIPQINKEEVHSWCYFSVHEIENELTTNPEKFTAWFKLCFDKVKQFTNGRNNKHILV
jgi:isopentenyl-diphosphate delta-isomerase